MSYWLSLLFVMLAALALNLGNYWFTYGLWPRNYWAFWGFGIGGVLLKWIYDAVDKEHKGREL